MIYVHDEPLWRDSHNVNVKKSITGTVLFLSLTCFMISGYAIPSFVHAAEIPNKQATQHPSPGSTTPSSKVPDDTSAPSASPPIPGYAALFLGRDLSKTGYIYCFLDRISREHNADFIFGPETIPVSQYLKTQWQTVTKQMPEMQPLEKLRVINGYFNRWKSANDSATYGQKEYWALPYEFFEKKQGDCEDYAIVKYLALRYFSWSMDDLWIMLVQGKEDKRHHAVLMARNGISIFVLDNLSKPFHLLIPAEEYYSRYRPLIALNERGVWYLRGNQNPGLDEDMNKKADPVCGEEEPGSSRQMPR